MSQDALPRDLNSIPKFGYDHLENVNKVAVQVWNPNTLSWEKMTQPIIDATNSNLYLTLDGVEALLGDIKLNTSNLVPVAYDAISISYTGENLTGVVYKTGGLSGTTVATLTLGYTGDKLTSVVRS